MCITHNWLINIRNIVNKIDSIEAIELYKKIIIDELFGMKLIINYGITF
jgi:hypothetical protein